MAVLPLSYLQTPPEEFRGGIISIGNFDGVHHGHQALLKTARELSAGNGPVIPVTFDPHPMLLLTPQRYQPPLTTITERARLLHAAGADHVVVLQTSPELLALSAEYFFETLIGQALAPRGIVEGFNFRFGKDRQGDNKLLQTMGEPLGIRFREVAALEVDGEAVSSSRLRQAIQAGDLQSYFALTGRRYRLSGTVIEGAKRGRTLGFPTANLGEVHTLIPGEGVYAVRVWHQGKPMMGAANIGPNPTFGEFARKIEIHLINFNGNLYGETLEVGFIARLRATQKFKTIEALMGQMVLDTQRAKVILLEEEYNHD